jgi:hypothetical protein
MVHYFSILRVFFTACIVVGVSSVAAAETVRLLLSSDFEGRNTVWEVPSEQLRGWPKWDPAKEPSLSVSAAVEKAFQALQPGEKRADWQLNSISLQQPIGEEARKVYGPLFFYYVSLNRKSDTWSVSESLSNDAWKCN